MMNDINHNPWGLPDGTKLTNRFGGEFQYCYNDGEWKLYNPWNNSYYAIDQKYFTERDSFRVVDKWERWDALW